MVFKRSFAIAFSAALVAIAAGCSGSGSTTTGTEPAKKDATPTPAVEAKPEPITLKLALNKAVMTDDELKQYIIDPVAKKYPYITIQIIDTAEKGKTLTDLVASKDIPDIYGNFPLNLNELSDLKLTYNIEELIKKYKFDTTRIMPELADSVKVGVNLDYLVGLPIFNQAFALFYNKDLFDRFGQAYPKDGMTWEQARDIAVKITRVDSGVQYYGMWPDTVYRGAYQISLPWGDFKNNKPVFQTDDWKNLFTMWYDLIKIPGHGPKGTNYTKEFNEGRLGMLAGSTSTLKTMPSVQNLNWEVVTYPQNTKAPGVGQRVDSFILTIPSQAKYKDDAFKVIDVVLSDEVQTLMSKNVRLSVLKDTKIQGEFGKNITAFQNKNVAAYTKLKFAPLKTFNNTPAATIVIQAFESMLYDNKDVNTALREADEKMTQEIQKQLNR